MPRGTQLSIDAKIAAAEAKIAAIQLRYDKAVAELKALKKKKEEESYMVVLDALRKSEKSIEEILEFLG